MDKVLSSATQARRKKLRHSQAHYLRGALMMIYRIRNKHPGLADDAEGRTFLMLLLALGLPPAEVDNHTSWITAQDLRAIRRDAKRFKATSTSIGVAIKLTDAEREKYGWRRRRGKRVRTSILLIRPCDVVWEIVERRREMEKNAKRRTKRQENNAALMTRIATYPPRQAAILSIERVRQWPGWCFSPFAWNIMRAMTKAERATFPADAASFRTAFYRAVAIMVKDGTLRMSGGVLGAARAKGRPGGFIRPTDLGLSVTAKDTQEFITPAATIIVGKKPKPIKPLNVEQFVTNHDTDVVMVPRTETTLEEAKRLASEVRASTSPDQPTAEPMAQMQAEIDRLHQELAKHQQVHDIDAVITTKRYNRSNR